MALSTKKVQEQVKYWLWNASEKLKTTKSLFESKRYADCLFYGHLVIECLLKGLVAKHTQKLPAKIHNLVVLARQSQVKLTKEQMELLAEVNGFHIEARYPEYKMRFFTKCNHAFAEIYFQKMNTLYAYLCRELR